jgi:hypothetical protein
LLQVIHLEANLPRLPKSNNQFSNSRFFIKINLVGI